MRNTMTGLAVTLILLGVVTLAIGFVTDNPLGSWVMVAGGLVVGALGLVVLAAQAAMDWWQHESRAQTNWLAQR